jgi:DNA-binding CsgD family transcriptional regulator/tetratricopeptide (TPR) repeat protein
MKEAIIYQEKALSIWKGKMDIQKEGNCMRFLSRLWWHEGNGKKSETYASQAIEVLNDQPFSKARAMALSNMSQLKMVSDQWGECMQWGEKAIVMAKELGDEESLCHALNNVGTTQFRIQSLRQKGIELLQQSLRIALKNSYEEHAARAYINLGSNAVVMKDYVLATKILDEGIQYCEERDMDGWKSYLLAFKARLKLETGQWHDAYRIADSLIKIEGLLPFVKIVALVIAATIKMRRGHKDIIPLLIEAKEKAFETMEQQRIIPVMAALLEYEWITGKSFMEKIDLDMVVTWLKQPGNVYEKSKLSFWLLKARNTHFPLDEFYEGYLVGNPAKAVKAAALWKQLGCPYEQALALFEGSEADKRMAISIVHRLDAEAVYEKMKFQMRASGIKSIPRGIRKTTRANPANLTEREMNILQLLKDGLQNKEIAASLFISPKTVSHHIYSIFFKLDVHSRTRAVQKAVHLNIVK